MNDRPIWLYQAGLVGIGEKPNWLLRANQDKMAETGKRRDGMVNSIRQERNRVTATSSLDQAIKGRCEESRVSRCRDPMSSSQGFGFEPGSGQYQSRWFAAAQHARTAVIVPGATDNGGAIG